MADNFVTDIGVGGETFASDEIGGIQHQRVKMQHGANGSATDVSSSSPLPIDIEDIGNLVSSDNSSTTPLGISGVFTGTGEDISKYAAINIMVFADEDSATDGLSLQWSSDNSIWDEVEPHTISADITFVTQAMGEGNYFRIVYTNGTTAQGAFRLHVVYKVIPSIGEVTHLDETITDSGDAQLVRSVLAAKKPDTTYTNIQATAGGNLKVAIEEADVSATGLAKAEDAVHTSGDTGVAVWGVRNDILAALVGTDGDYAPFQVNDIGALWTHHAPNDIDSNNSTTTPLGVSGVFTGTGTDLLDSSTVAVTIDASHDSATDGMQFQFSTDNVNWDITHNFTYTAADGGRVFQMGSHTRYFRVVFTNGTTEQTHLRIQALRCHGDLITTIHRLVDNVDPDRSATIVKSVIIAQGAGSGDFVPVQATAAGNFKMSVQEISDGLDVGAGNAGSETQRVSISTDDINLSAIKATMAGPDASGPSVDSYTQVAINLTTGANQVLASSAANKQIWVYGYTFTCGDAAGQTVSFQDEDDTALSGIMEFAQYGGAALAPSGNFSMPIWKLSTDKDLEIDITGGDVDGWLTYAILSV